MRALDRSAEEAARRRWGSLLASLVLHALLLAVWDPRPEPLPEEQVVEVSLVKHGSEQAEPAPEAAPPPPPAPAQPKPPPRAPKPAPEGERVADVRPEPPAPAPAPPAPPEPRPPMSFQDWQRSRASYVPSQATLAAVRGSIEGRDAVDRRGRNRCEPPSGRRAEVAYLLFDSSGSMNGMMQAQALTCAHQYAKAVLDGGGEVVVGNFALGATFTPRTRDMLDIQGALRAASDPRATVLPTRELQPFLDEDPDAVADLVIISDGFFGGSREVVVWYQYFLELNPENRGMMYTVGTPGARESVSMLRDMGFDVYMYEQIRR